MLEIDTNVPEKHRMVECEWKLFLLTESDVKLLRECTRENKKDCGLCLNDVQEGEKCRKLPLCNNIKLPDISPTVDYAFEINVKGSKNTQKYEIKNSNRNK